MAHPSIPDLDLESKQQQDAQPSLTPSDETVTEAPMPLAREVPFMTLICLAQLLTQAGLGQAIAPLHIIGDSFGITDPALLSWFPAAYSLTVGTFILPAGRLGDILGHRTMFIVGFIWYGVWSLLAGISVYSGQILFDICRAFQGIGPAILLPNALAILGTTYPPGKRKNMAFSLFGATAPGGFVFGACFSSLFGQLAWWPWAYWTMAMVCIFLGASALVIIPKSKEDRLPLTWSMFDPYGTIFSVSGLILVNFAWNQGASAGWTIVYTYVLLIIGIVLLLVFGFIETRVAHPLVPFQQLTKDVIYVMGCIAFGWSSFGIWVFYIWQLMEELRGYTPLEATACMVPTAISGLCAAITTGFVLHKTGPSVVMLISMVAFTVGSILIATAPVKQTYWIQTFIGTVIMPWGMVNDYFLNTARRMLMRLIGYVLSICNNSPQPGNATRASGYRSVSYQHRGKLLHFPGTRLCGDRREQRQRWRNEQSSWLPWCTVYGYRLCGIGSVDVNCLYHRASFSGNEKERRPGILEYIATRTEMCI